MPPRLRILFRDSSLVTPRGRCYFKRVIWIGTSGFQYPEWKGTFYPDDLQVAKMLGFYAERFPTTEINYTFRRMPSEKTLANWSAQTPAPFRFTLKAPQQITHARKLRDCGAVLQRFHDVAVTLGDKLGIILFQLPPHLRKDVSLLEDFLGALPCDWQCAFEFRHESWLNDAVFALLASARCALCIADSPRLRTPVRVTADFAYFRLRDEGYRAADIKRWAAEIGSVSARAKDIYVYFKHEEKGLGPKFALQLLAQLAKPRPNKTRRIAQAKVVAAKPSAPRRSAR